MMILIMKVGKKRLLYGQDTDTELLEPESHRTKRQRRTSTFEGDDGKKKCEKRPGMVRLEGPTYNLQVLDPKRKQWRESPSDTEMVR